jgi:hypothetical protein
VTARPNHEDPAVMKEIIEAGKLTPVIDRRCPLSEALKLWAMSKRDTLEVKLSSSFEANPIL